MSFRAWGASGRALAKRPWKFPKLPANRTWEVCFLNFFSVLRNLSLALFPQKANA